MPAMAPRSTSLLALSALSLAIAAAWPAHAAEPLADAAGCPVVAGQPDTCHAKRLAPVTVAATLNPRPLGEVAADVSVIDRAAMDRHLVSDLRGLVRYEPGVSVTATPGRYGEDGFDIRGLGGNRVRIEIDGVPVSDAFAFGSMLSAGRDSVDMEAIKRVEIVRGPASSLYGSDALGGVVSYVTKNPADYLADGRHHYLAVKQQYDSANRGSASTATLALGNPANGLLLQATHREGHATNDTGTVDSADASRTRPDPLDQRSDAVQAKYVHTAASGRTDRLVLDGQRGTVESDLLSARGPSTALLRADNHTRRHRLSLGQSWNALDNVLADRLAWQAWWQDSRVRQQSLELRSSGPGYERHVDQTFGQRVRGARLNAFKHADAGSVAHDFTWGVAWSRTDTTELRNGYAINLATGARSTTTAGGNADNYPARDFPPGTTTTAAVFVQDEMRLADDRWRLIPGLRLDHYRFAPRADALFDAQPLAEHVQGQTDRHVSPKLGAVWQFAEHFNLYAQYASGFRAPPYSDLGLLFSNLRYGYAAIPNPDLKPETSRSTEIGLRGEGDAGHFTVAAYRNRYRDFIDSEHLIARSDWPDWAAATPGLGMVFQSVNLTRARIQGVEASGTLYLDAFGDALSGWQLRGSAGWARGDAREEGGAWTPLDSVDPARAVLGAGYEAERWGVELDGTFVARKNRLDDPAAFHAPGYASVDLYAHWQPSSMLALYAGLTNLGNRHYWDWGNLHGGTLGSGVAASSVIDRYSAPGRAFSVAARLSF